MNGAESTKSTHIEQLRQVMIEALPNLLSWTNPKMGANLTADQADAILAATYPPACQTCDGDGEVPADDIWMDHNEPLGDGWQGVHPTLPCPDCPTIAQLLVWGVAVATWETDDAIKSVLLDAIRAVKPASASEAQS